MSLYADYHPHTSVKGLDTKMKKLPWQQLINWKMDKNGGLVKKLCLKEKSESECSKKLGL